MVHFVCNDVMHFKEFSTQGYLGIQMAILKFVWGCKNECSSVFVLLVSGFLKRDFVVEVIFCLIKNFLEPA